MRFGGGVRYWPLERGRIVTSPFGPRWGGFHYGTDFGFPGGSANRPVYAIQSGVVKFVGAAQGYGGPDPHGWIVVESSESEGGGTFEYGHVTRLPNVVVGSRVSAGQQIATINPSSATNGGTAPHLHLSEMPGRYSPSQKRDPMPKLSGALDPPASSEKEKDDVAERPDFNEFPVWSPNVSSRNGTRVDLFLLHTQEGGSTKDGAYNLAKWMGNRSAGVSYHYTISMDPHDKGVTVCDTADTDLASWSVLSANNRSINLCFAGSRASWTHDEWMRWAGRAIDVAAYLAVADAKKYKFSPRVLAPPYNSNPPGISDHAYVTRWLKDGTHTDCGPNFPWKYFSERVAYYSGVKPVPAQPVPAQPSPVGSADDQLVMRWNCLGGQTLVEAVAEMRDKLLGTDDRSKTGVRK
jgi:murein DD-endopeptidase MepM/ murein hydrolase activator NlpD